MKKILFPTDFSKSAYNAIDYALIFSQLMQARLVLLHTCPVESALNDILFKDGDAEMEKVKKDGTALLLFQDLMIIKYKSEFSERPFPEFKLVKKTGKVVNTILETAKEESAELIIVGDNTVNTFLGNLIVESTGTHASHISIEAQCPVLLIPLLAKYKPIKNIIYAVELSNNEVGLLHQALKFANLFNANFEILHLYDKPNEPIKDKIQLELEEEFGSLENVSFKKIKKDDVIQGLNNYIREQKPDLLIHVNREQP